jgi:hypothetical protein
VTVPLDGGFVVHTEKSASMQWRRFEHEASAPDSGLVVEVCHPETGAMPWTIRGAILRSGAVSSRRADGDPAWEGLEGDTRIVLQVYT